MRRNDEEEEKEGAKEDRGRRECRNWKKRKKEIGCKIVKERRESRVGG